MNLVPWQGVFMFFGIAIAATLLLAVRLRHRNKLALAGVAATREEAYRELAATSAAEIKRMADEVAALREAVGEVQRLLREVGE